MVARNDGPVNDRPARPNKECHYSRKVQRKEAEDRLLHGSVGAYKAALEAFEALVREGLDFCEADGTEGNDS
jgi:hypothetical protein